MLIADINREPGEVYTTLVLTYDDIKVLKALTQHVNPAFASNEKTMRIAREMFDAIKHI